VGASLVRIELLTDDTTEVLTGGFTVTGELGGRRIWENTAVALRKTAKQSKFQEGMVDDNNQDI